MQVVIHFLTASVERTAGEAVHQAAIRNPCCNPCRNPCLVRQRGMVYSGQAGEDRTLLFGKLVPRTAKI
jgi:hypothetical protein